MAKYRKKPVVVEAFQWTAGQVEFPDWAGQAGREGRLWVIAGPMMRVVTLNGPVTAHPGDFIVKGVQGELYPCSLEIFEATYEKVEEGL